MKLKLKPRDQIIIAVVVILLIVILFFLFGIRPKIASIGNLKKQITSEEDKKKTSQANLSRLEALKKESIEVEAEIIKMGKKMPSEAELPSLVIDIQEIALETGVNIRSITPGQPEEVKDYKQIPVNLEIIILGDNSHTIFIDFLSRLENMPRKILVDGISVDPFKETEQLESQQQIEHDLPDIFINVNTKTFVYAPGVGGEEQAEGGGAAPPPPE